MKTCIICGNCLTICKNLYDDRYGYPGKFVVLRCSHCGHKSLDATFSSQDLSRLYTEFYPRTQFSVEEHHPYAERVGFMAWLDGAQYSAFRWIPRNVRVLDIGCGFGETLGYHKARGCDVYGVEADANIQRVADRFDYKVNVGLFDSNNYKHEYFDFVTMDQVLEHVTDPLEVLIGIAKVMKTSGALIVSTPNANGWGARVFGNKWINWHTPYHLQFFSRESMKMAAEKTGFVLEHIETITCSDWLYLQWNHLLIYPEMGKHSMFWDPQSKRTVTQKLLIRLMMLIHKTKINHIITRIFDALGIGDNYVFVLRKNR